jgi:hypothetical protein
MNLRVAKAIPRKEQHPQEIYASPMSQQTQLPACEESKSFQRFSLRNLLAGSSVMLDYQQRIPGLFEGARPILKQELEPPVNRITGSNQFPDYVTSRNSQMLPIGEVVREYCTVQAQQEDPHNHG